MNCMWFDAGCSTQRSVLWWLFTIFPWSGTLNGKTFVTVSWGTQRMTSHCWNEMGRSVVTQGYEWFFCHEMGRLLERNGTTSRDSIRVPGWTLRTTSTADCVETVYFEVETSQGTPPSGSNSVDFINHEKYLIIQIHEVTVFNFLRKNHDFRKKRKPMIFSR